MKKILTIAGTDPSGGAGIQADLKTFAVYKAYGMSVITSIVAQNTYGVFAMENLSNALVKAQLDAVFSDIFPDAVKIGMVSNSEIIEVVATSLQKEKPENIVLDPVMVSTSQHRLLDNDAEKKLMEILIPLADVITPNIPEAEILCNFPIKNEMDMESAAKSIAKWYKGSILIKGGHNHNSEQKNCNDLLYYDGSMCWLTGEKISTSNTHGTGCTLSSAIAVRLAEGETVLKAVKYAKEYVRSTKARIESRN
ncbi:MAG: bifunctional hydroxymethylpyrimidine kinase/phosphomethylpyrimidine kinase [Candidatus Theseobacter exili]|nr:bifunctional hydroxymethylpyrimidine kinase/phosphomethylpyrimidine kinase [Candidatus Theseobacter exili]